MMHTDHSDYCDFLSNHGIWVGKNFDS